MVQNYTSIDDLIELYDQAVPSLAKHAPDPASYPQSNQPVSLPKEAAPGGSQMSEITPIHEAVEKQEVEPELEPFIDVKPQNIKISDDLKKMGLQPIEKTKYKDFENIHLPLPDEEIEKGLHAPITSSLRWLATLAVYILHQSHLRLKRVHGKVVRVFVK